MLASHNSMSYLPPVTWWGKLIRPWSQCQSATLQEQLLYGVHYFDLRVFYKYHKGKGYKLHFCHGITDYGVVTEQVFELLNRDKAIIRFSMDVRKRPNNPEKLKRWMFWDIKNLKQKYPNITFDSVKFFWEEWSIDYGKQQIAVTEKHWSVVPKKWYEWLMPIKYFAKKYRVKWLVEENHSMVYSKKEALMIDYVKG